MVSSTECGYHIMLLHGDRVKLNGTHEYLVPLSKLDGCLTLRADVVRSVAHTLQASLCDIPVFLFGCLCVQQPPTIRQGEEELFALNIKGDEQPDTPRRSAKQVTITRAAPQYEG